MGLAHLLLFKQVLGVYKCHPLILSFFEVPLTTLMKYIIFSYVFIIAFILKIKNNETQASIIKAISPNDNIDF